MLHVCSIMCGEPCRHTKDDTHLRVKMEACNTQEVPNAEDPSSICSEKRMKIPCNVNSKYNTCDLETMFLHVS